MVFDQSWLLYVPFAAILTWEGSFFNRFSIHFQNRKEERIIKQIERYCRRCCPIL